MHKKRKAFMTGKCKIFYSSTKQRILPVIVIKCCDDLTYDYDI